MGSENVSLGAGPDFVMSVRRSLIYHSATIYVSDRTSAGWLSAYSRASLFNLVKESAERNRGLGFRQAEKVVWVKSGGIGIEFYSCFRIVTMRYRPHSGLLARDKDAVTSYFESALRCLLRFD
jgi:hypothetical protein